MSLKVAAMPLHTTVSSLAHTGSVYPAMRRLNLTKPMRLACKKKKKTASSAEQPRASASAGPEATAKFSCMQDLGKTCTASGLTDDAVDVLVYSWRPVTVKAYDTYFKTLQDSVHRNKIILPLHVDIANFSAIFLFFLLSRR